MIIPAAKLHKYVRKMVFPVHILEEKGAYAEYIVDRETFEQMADLGCIFGVGSWKHLKHVRLARPAGEVEGLKLKLRKVPHPTTFHYQEKLGDGMRLPMLKRLRGPLLAPIRWQESLTFAELRNGK